MMVPLGGGRWQCSQCGYQAAKSTNVRNHIEAKHVASEGYNCRICGAYYLMLVLLLDVSPIAHNVSPIP